MGKTIAITLTFLLNLLTFQNGTAWAVRPLTQFEIQTYQNQIELNGEADTFINYLCEAGENTFKTTNDRTQLIICEAFKQYHAAQTGGEYEENRAFTAPRPRPLTQDEITKYNESKNQTEATEYVERFCNFATKINDANMIDGCEALKLYHHAHINEFPAEIATAPIPERHTPAEGGSEKAEDNDSSLWTLSGGYWKCQDQNLQRCMKSRLVVDQYFVFKPNGTGSYLHPAYVTFDFNWTRQDKTISLSNKLTQKKRTPLKNPNSFPMNSFVMVANGMLKSDTGILYINREIVKKPSNDRYADPPVTISTQGGKIGGKYYKCENQSLQICKQSRMTSGEHIAFGTDGNGYYYHPDFKKGSVNFKWTLQGNVAHVSDKTGANRYGPDLKLHPGPSEFPGEAFEMVDTVMVRSDVGIVYLRK